MCLQWRARLVEALRTMSYGGIEEQEINLNKSSGSIVSTEEQLSNKA